MYPLNDKDLDRLSRDAADQYDVEPSASGWEHLEKRLNKELPVKDEKDRRRFLLWLFFIAILSGGGLTWMLTGKGTSNAISQNTITVPSQKDKTNSDTKTVQPKSSTTIIPGSNNPENTTGKETEDNAVNQPVTATTKQQPLVNSEESKEQITGNSSQPKTESNKTTKTEKQAAGNNTGITKANTSNKKNNPVLPSPRPARRYKQPAKSQPAELAANDKAEYKDVIKENNKPGKEETGKEKVSGAATANTETPPVTKPATITDPTSTVTDTKAANKEPEVAATTAKPAAATIAGKKEPAKKKTATPVTAPLELGILFGPDFSNVKFKHSYKTGINIGLQVGYRLSNRLQVNSGFIYTKKYYKADGDDFHSPKHSWMSYVDMKKVQGNCYMFEIPVNLRYDFSVRKQNRYFVNAGLSTYLMSGEYYDYNFIYQGVERTQSTKSDSNSNYLFSVLNLSAGYEHALGKQFSLQAEPYLKLPLKGIGYGSMKLDSYGIYFTLKYKPEFGKGKK